MQINQPTFLLYGYTATRYADMDYSVVSTGMAGKLAFFKTFHHPHLKLKKWAYFAKRIRGTT